MFDDPFSKENPISQLLKTFAPEENIFRQGKPGQNMFIIIEGYIKIIFESESHNHLVGIAGPGEILGEKAVLKAGKQYIRNFSAVASTDVTLLEVNPQTLVLVLANWPDFYVRLLKLIEERLAKANELVGILQNPSPVDRICAYILYFQKHLCGKFPKGMYASISLAEIIFSSNVSRDLAEEVVEYLVTSGILSPVADGYILRDQKALVQSIPALRERNAA